LRHLLTSYPRSSLRLCCIPSNSTFFCFDGLIDVRVIADLLCSTAKKRRSFRTGENPGSYYFSFLLFSTKIFDQPPCRKAGSALICSKTYLSLIVTRSRLTYVFLRSALN
jgi:hypothetical protein